METPLMEQMNGLATAIETDKNKRAAAALEAIQSILKEYNCEIDVRVEVSRDGRIIATPFIAGLLPVKAGG